MSNRELLTTNTEELQLLMQKCLEKKRKHYEATRRYVLKDPQRSNNYSKAYYHKMKMNPEFKKNARERALKYYYKKKEILLQKIE